LALLDPVQAQLAAGASAGAHAQLAGQIGAARDHRHGLVVHPAGQIGAARGHRHGPVVHPAELAEDGPVHVPTAQQPQTTTSSALAEPHRGVISFGNQTCPSAELYHLRYQAAQA
jgi:hypothetical protein